MATNGNQRDPKSAMPSQPVAVQSVSSPTREHVGRPRWLDVINTLVNVLGFVAVACSVWHLATETEEVAQQTKLSAEAIRNEAYVSMSTWTLELDKAFLDQPELRPFFASGVAIDEDHAEYAKVETLAEMTLDMMDSILELEPLFSNKESLEGWKEWMRSTFAESPIVCKHLEHRRKWYRRVGPFYEEWKRTNGKH